MSAPPRMPGVSIKKFLPRTLFGRSLLILVIPVVLIQVITAFMFFDRHWQRMTSRLALAVAGEISLLSKVIEEGGDQDFIERYSLQAARVLDLRVEYMPGGDLPTKRVQNDDTGVWQMMIKQSLYRELLGVMNRPFVVYIRPDEPKTIYVAVRLRGGVLNVSMPDRRLFSSSSYIFLLWMAGSSLILLLIAVVFMRNQIRPIRRLAVAADRFGKGQEVRSFKPSGAREVRQASEAFIDMHRRIRRQIEQRTLMLAGVSHDLRTPLTRLKLQVEMLGDTADVKAIKSDIQDMERMITGYLDFVRGEGGEEPCAISAEGFFQKIKHMAERQNIDLAVDLESSMPTLVTLKPIAFERCIMNVLNNAAVHAEKIWLTVMQEGQKLRIVIEDNGPGIPEELYEEVFRPFYRVDQSRGNSSGHVGLGLPIAKDIVHDRGGRIALDRSEHGGLKVIINIPL